MKIDSKFQTPLDICEYMVNMIPKNSENILEPTPGLGNILRVLEKKGFQNITAPDDFFLLNPNEKYDCVIMNPPFSSKSAFMDNAPSNIEVRGMKIGYYILKECMKKSNNIIALMPWFTISDSDVRMRFLTSFGLKSVTPLPRKTFEYVRIQTVVLELEKNYKGDTIFHTSHFKVNPNQEKLNLK